MISGIDSPLDCSNKVGEIRAAQKSFVGRYYRKPGSQWAALTASEVTALRAGGLKIIALWEYASNKPDYFSHARGVDDGTSAYHQALIAGQTPETPIYFAVDFDATSEAIAGPVSDYFRGVADGYRTIGSGNPAFLIGVYGSGRTCGWLQAHGRVGFTWLAESTGWAGYHTFTDWRIKQGPGDGELAFDHDTDQALADCGAF